MSFQPLRVLFEDFLRVSGEIGAVKFVVDILERRSGGVIAARPRLIASIAESECALSRLKACIDSGIRLLLPITD